MFTPVGVFLTAAGVALAGVDVEAVVLFTGVFFTAVAGFETAVGVLAVAVGVFLAATGSGFFVPSGVRAGFEAALIGACFTGVTVGVVLFAGETGSGFLVPSGVRTGVAFAGVAVFTGVAVDGDAGVPAGLIFLGTLLTGVVVVLVVAGVAGFLTGVTLLVVVVVFAGVVTGFFVADPATFEMFPTFAKR